MVYPKTHSAIVLKLSENIAFGEPRGREWVATETCGGQLQPSTPQDALTKYGLDINAGFEWFGDESSPPVVINDRMQIGTALYEVASGPKVWNAVASTAHWSCFLVEIADDAE